VVGIDGSDGSLEALRFAAEEARVRAATLRVVAAWRVPPPVYAGGFAGDLGRLSEHLREGAEAVLDAALEGMAGALEGVAVERLVGEGQAAHVLVDAAADAALLVVGSRGLGGFGGLLLGSVSQQAATHAPCPVVIVPGRRGDG
jgi:nucleotide-binding universal stress UspA family protein